MEEARRSIRNGPRRSLFYCICTISFLLRVSYCGKDPSSPTSPSSSSLSRCMRGHERQLRDHGGRRHGRGRRRRPIRRPRLRYDPRPGRRQRHVEVRMDGSSKRWYLLTNESSRTFPLLPPPRRGMGCAVEVAYEAGRISRAVFWLMGGVGGLRHFDSEAEESSAKCNSYLSKYARISLGSYRAYSDEMSRFVDTINVLDRKSQWLVGDVNKKLKLSTGRPFPAFAILSERGSRLAMTD